MMVKKLLKICLASTMITLLNSCSLAGSWVYERIDDYLSDYFKDFATFSAEQNKEIDLISEAFLDWFTVNELPKVKAILENLKKMDYADPTKEIARVYEEGEKIIDQVNDYFEKPIIDFSKGLTQDQVNQIGLHFEKLRKKREEEREKENQSYKERILENYKTGFDRVGIKLQKNQLEFIESKLKGYIEIRKEWSDLQQEWIEEFLNLLNNNRTEGYDQKMSLYLKSLENLGNEAFRGKVRKNEKLTLEIIGSIFKSVNEAQIKRFNRSLDTYLKSINRILSKRKVN